MNAPKRRRNARGSGESLRGEIVQAAKDQLARTHDADAVSIRSVADAVRVTPPSIYLHFADKNELLRAVVGDVFGELDVAMTKAAAAETSPLGRLRAFGLAYVDFAVAHPEHYRLAAMDPCPTPVPAVDDVLASSAFAHFNETVVECIEAGIFAGDPLEITFDLWAAAHGTASLVIAKPYLPWGDVAAFADRALCAAALGHGVLATFDEPPTPDVVTGWLSALRRRRPGRSGAPRRGR